MEVRGRDDDRFPKKLLEVRPRVERFFYKGEWSEEILSNCVAVVGSRRMSDYGRRVVAKLVPVLVKAGVTVVSGFMYGIDQEAHRVCLEMGGRTIAVLGWGIDWKVSGMDKKLYSDILNNRGLIVSEYEGGRKAQGWMFVERNRIVAGLAEAVIVVEGAMRSGSLVTAALALKMGRKVLVVPGPIVSTVSGGTNWLIKRGLGRMVLNEDDLIDELGLIKVMSEKSLVGVGAVVLRALENRSMAVDELSMVLGMKTEALLVELSELEIAGLIEQRGGRVSRRQGNG